MIWAACRSLAAITTTNNVAECVGLYVGLTLPKRLGLLQIKVVDDSQPILSQLRRHRPPGSLRLLSLYATARLLAIRVVVVSGAQHYRRNNKIADFLANLAVDSALSAQDEWPPANTLLQDTADSLGNDSRIWVDT